MPSLKSLKVRITSVKSTQKITKAMKMVAAAKLRRAQEAAEAARPYAERMTSVLASLGSRITVGPESPRLLAGTGSDQVHLLVVATSERGLAGAFNTNIVRAARRTADRLLAEGKTVKFYLIGKKGRAQLARNVGGALPDAARVASRGAAGLRPGAAACAKSGPIGQMQTPAELVLIPRDPWKALESSGKLLHFGKILKIFGQNLAKCN